MKPMAIDNPPDLSPADYLTLEEANLVRAAFVDVFNDLVKSYATDGDIHEINQHLSQLHADLRVHKLVIDQPIEYYRDLIFTSHVIRDFHLELIDRVSLEITPIGKNAYKRLVHTLARGLAESKAKFEGANQTFDPINTSIAIKFEDACKSYFQNPWVVGLTLIARWFRKTTLGVDLTPPKPTKKQ